MMMKARKPKMKKICDFRCYVAVGKKEYEDTSMWKHLRYCEAGATEEYVASWGDFYDLVEGHCIRNAELTTNLFNKPVVKIGWADIYKRKTKITARNFHRIWVKWSAEPVDRLYSIKDLAEMRGLFRFTGYVGIRFKRTGYDPIR
jgi:hypothetical protein